MEKPVPRTSKEEKRKLRRKLRDLEKAVDREREQSTAITQKRETLDAKKRELMGENSAAWESNERTFKTFKSADPKENRNTDLGPAHHHFFVHQPVDMTAVKKGRSSRRTGLYQDVTGVLHFGPSESDHKKELLQNIKRSTTSGDSAENGLGASQAAAEWVRHHEAGKATVALKGHGVPTLPDLGVLRYKSSRRTRWYTDYEGKRILVDDCDFPEHYRNF
eukprot:PhM_4_TR5301/c1_g1_i1/m.3837